MFDASPAEQDVKILQKLNFGTFFVLKQKIIMIIYPESVKIQNLLLRPDFFDINSN